MKASEMNDAPKVAEAPKAETRRWGAELKPVVNTSLPAQLAPKLAPVTLASATTSLAPINLKHNKTIASVTSMEDFPSLGGKKFQTTTITPKMSFAELSRSWADKQKEEEAKAKEEAEKARMKAQLEQNERLRIAKDEMALRRTGLVSIPNMNRKKVDSDEERYLDEEKSSNSDEPYLSDDGADDVYEDDQEEEEEYLNDGTWDSRKHRDELY